MGRTVIRKAGPPCFTDNWKEAGGGSVSAAPQKFRAFGSPVGRPLHTSALSAGIPQRASTDTSRHIKLRPRLTARAKQRLQRIYSTFGQRITLLCAVLGWSPTMSHTLSDNALLHGRPSD